MKRKLTKLISVLTAVAVTAGCTACVQEETGTLKVVSYQPTEENEKLEMTMNNQPESSYWFPKQLLEWNEKEDPDFVYNVSTVPLAQRADREKLQTVNGTQNKNTNIMAISIMNSSTSGNAPHGLNKSTANTFSYWQYVDTLVYWGGSSGEGLIVPPSPDVTDAGHKNGVKVLGTIFFPQTDHGGKLEWLDDFLQKDASGNFPLVDKLIEVAQSYGFDGWFFNQESQGTDEAPLTQKQAELTQEFICAFKEKAPKLDMVYYDSMTNDGKMDWQNALTDNNITFLQTEQGNPVADSMFLNFWWTEDKYASQELLKNSAAKAETSGIDPYSLYAGVDVQSDGYLTPIQWNLFESSTNSTYTSLGLYCPNWAYTSANDMEDFWAKENALWVNSKGDPSAEISPSSNTEWRGISSYAVERTAITSLPFITNFNVGNGYSFFKNGEQISKMDWNNRSISDLMPTYRYMIANEGNNSLSARLDVGNAWYGGSSLKLRGSMGKDNGSTIKLYSTDLVMTKDISFTATVKATVSTEVSLIAGLDNGSEVVIEGDKKAGTDWTTISFDTSKIDEKTLGAISFKLTTTEDAQGYECNLGNISVTDNTKESLSTVTDVTIDDQEFDEDGMYAGVRVSWKSDEPANYYEIYRINQDKTKSLLGVSNTTSFYINALPRTDETNKSIFEVVPVTGLLKEGTSASVTMDWPDNSIPKAGFAADVTLVAPGEPITFTSLCSQNKETVNWEFAGADTESAQGETATVTYSKEGIYDVSVTAKNKSGTADKKAEGYIVVTSKAQSGLTLLSKNCAVSASSFINENEAPQFAVDGDKTKKWCATGTAPHEIILDLGSEKTVSAMDIAHAEEGGEGSDMNTKAYSILTSLDGKDYTEAVNITKNTAGSTHNAFAPAKARYVKLIINKPTQGSDSAARIYEVEVYGLE